APPPGALPITLGVGEVKIRSFLGNRWAVLPGVERLSKWPKLAFHGVTAVPHQESLSSCRQAIMGQRSIGAGFHTFLRRAFWALRENSWKSTPIEGVAGNLVIQQERPPNEAEAKSPSIRLFNAFVCPPRFSDLRSPPSSGRGRFGHLLHLVDRSRTNPWRKENACRAPSAQVSKAPDPALIVHRQVFDSMIDACLRRRPSPLLGKNRTQLHRCRGCRPRIRTGRRPAQARAAKIENAVKPAKGL